MRSSDKENKSAEMAARGSLQPLVIGYWTIRGLGQQVRLMCEVLGLPWENRLYETKETAPGVYDRSDWLQVKETLGLEFPNLPYLIDPNTNMKLTETEAILRYLAEQYRPKMLGATIAERAKINMLCGVLRSLHMHMISAVYSSSEAYPRLRDSMLKSAVEKVIPKLLQARSQNELMMGNEITLVDIPCYELFTTLNLMDTTCLQHDSTKGMAEYLRNFESKVDLVKFNKSGKSFERPVNNLMAAFK